MTVAVTSKDTRIRVAALQVTSFLVGVEFSLRLLKGSDLCDHSPHIAPDDVILCAAYHYLPDLASRCFHLYFYFLFLGA